MKLFYQLIISCLTDFIMDFGNIRMRSQGLFEFSKQLYLDNIVDAAQKIPINIGLNGFWVC
ncbi:MAG: hypothetical protein K6F33_01430 [Bacteroidales bacterium]|nr:hypothetical protein [Bacteroidales bacterium]